MDHVFLPSKPRLQLFEFPLLCQPTYQSETWQSYPEEHGYQVTGEISGDFQIFKITDDGQQDITESDEEAVAAFFQQWLWFGILSEILESVDIATFVRRKPDGTQWLTTTHLQKHSKALIASAPDQSWASSPDMVQEWGSHRWQMIRRARTVAMRYLQTYECSADNIVPRTIFAVALLCEHLHEVLSRVYYRTTVDDPWEAIPKFNWREDDADCAMAITEELNEGGWCPNTLAGMGMYSSKIETLWFYANLEAPKRELGHDDCSAEQCVHLQIDHETYRTKHLTGDCDCDIVGPDPSALTDIVINGKLPLTRVLFGAEGTVEKIDIQPREADTKFVAISHVWADGHGNPDGNLLPTCFLRALQKVVDEIASGESVLFWMDTLSIPREPRSVRKLALKYLRDPYDYAAHVLVLDSYLQDQKGQGCSVIELLALINVSSWAQRLWTFQEGRLAKDIWVQFADGKICMSDGDGVKDALRSEVVSEVPSDMVAFHTSTNSVTEFWARSASGFVSIPALREGVRLRSTSVRTDEALCLGSIAGFDMGKILDQPEAERMDTFWRAVPSIPAGLGLSKASVKLEAKGLRWAPASLMGDIDNNEWDGPTSMLGETAELSPEGLACQLAAFKFPSTAAPAFENSLKALYQIASDENHNIWDVCYGIQARTYRGRWLICVFEEPWHQTPINAPEGAIPAILLEQPTYMLDGSQPTESLAGDNISALFVHYTPSTDGKNQQAHAIRHCSLYFQSHKQCAFLEELDTITHQLMDENWDGLITKSDDWDKLYEFIEPLVPNYILRSPCLEIGKQALKAVRGTDDIDDQAVVNNAIAIIAMFCFIGPYRDVDYDSERKKWVID